MTDNEIFDIWDSYKRILKIHKDNVGGTVERELVISQGVADGTCDLINRLKANEEKNENIIRLADKTIEKQQAEIERLSETVIDINAKLSESIHCFTRMETLYKIKCNELKVAKSEARKEFVERFKEEVAHIPAWGRVAEKKIDNLLKEMEEQ